MKTFKVITLAVLAAMLFPASAMAYSAIASTTISNTANIDWDGNGVPVNSNTAVINVDELIDVTETWDDGSNITGVLSATNQVLEFTVTNTGNGRETFNLSTSFTNNGPGAFTLAAAEVWIDSDGDGVFNSGSDTNQWNTGVLGNTSSINVFIVSTFGAAGTDGDTINAFLEVATATTGFGGYVAGNVSADAGDGGVGFDAVLGTTTGQVLTVSGIYELAAATLAIFKTYSAFHATLGDDLAIPGATVRYHLNVTGSGGGYATTVTLRDAIPTFTHYSSNSITVQGVTQTDGGGDDYGDYNVSNAGEVTVIFGNFSAVWTRDVYFNVVID